MTKIKQKPQASITATERVILAGSAGIILLSFVLHGLFYTFSLGFLIILVIDVILLAGVKVPGIVKRLALLASIMAALFLVFFAVNTLLK